MITPTQLLPDKRRERFLEELAAHAGDSGASEELGLPHDLANAFNMYSIERRQKILPQLALLILAIAIMTTYSMHEAYTDNGEINSIFEFLPVMPGVFLLFPVILIGLGIIVIFAPMPLVSLMIEHASWLAPLAATISWSVIIYMLNFNPPKLLQRFAKK